MYCPLCRPKYRRTSTGMYCPLCRPKYRRTSMYCPLGSPKYRQPYAHCTVHCANLNIEVFVYVCRPRNRPISRDSYVL